MKTVQTLKDRFELDEKSLAKITGGDVLKSLKNNEEEGDMA
ncbi:MAG: ComC/BlpC family leader-containing pheromone/bacteriocin [Bacteroidota bacterium]